MRNLWSSVLLAVGVSGAIAVFAPDASAQDADVSVDASAEVRPGPLDVIVNFQAGSNEIDVTAHAGLDEMAVWLKQDPQRVIYVEAHPDESARVGFSATVASDRSESARRYLVAHGVADVQIKVIPFGQRRTIYNGGDRNARTIFLSSGVAVEGSISASATLTPAPPAEPAPPVADTLAPPPAPPAPPATRTELIVTPMVYDADPSDDHLLTDFGMAISLGAGVVDFLDDDASGFTDTGGSWEARLTLGTRTPLALEAAYVGSAQDIDALGLDSQASLIGTMVEGDARLNLTTSAVQPYIFGGLGYTHYEVMTDEANNSSLQDEEDMGHVPVGAGLAFQYRGLLLDVRGTLRAAFNDDLVNGDPVATDEPDLVPDEGDAKAELDTWNLAARIGWEF